MFNDFRTTISTRCPIKQTLGILNIEQLYCFMVLQVMVIDFMYL